MEKEQGTVTKWFDEGFGFITPATPSAENELYVSKRTAYDGIGEGDVVQFSRSTKNPAPGERRQAIEVTKVASKPVSPINSAAVPSLDGTDEKNASEAVVVSDAAPAPASNASLPDFQQKIIFGPPGTGKSYSVSKIEKELGCVTIRTVFHPEYSYGDFVAKLLPLTVHVNGSARVEYQIHAGALIKALARALSDSGKTVLLVIEEINRGNCAAIFGDIFQLLDREPGGDSSYPIAPTDLTRLALAEELARIRAAKSGKPIADEREAAAKELARILAAKSAKPSGEERAAAEDEFAGNKLSLPSNLFIVATMNTSDESVFYMDSAFKRRWQFQYIGPDHETENWQPSEEQRKATVDFKDGDQTPQWDELRQAINQFLLASDVRRIEDKQLGLWFVRARDGKIPRADIEFKLMHYLWDNVFARDKKPLQTLLAVEEKELRTFGQFVAKTDAFIAKVIEHHPSGKTAGNGTK